MTIAEQLQAQMVAWILEGWVFHRRDTSAGGPDKTRIHMGRYAWTQLLKEGGNPRPDIWIVVCNQQIPKKDIAVWARSPTNRFDNAKATLVVTRPKSLCYDDRKARRENRKLKRQE